MGLRQDRLADEIRDVVARCFMGGTLSDPRLHNVTVTAVKLSGDLQLASIYFRIMGDEKPPKEVFSGLESATGFLRKQLANALDVRRVPNLRFFYDESVEKGSHIEGLIAKLNSES